MTREFEKGIGNGTETVYRYSFIRGAVTAALIVACPLAVMFARGLPNAKTGVLIRLPFVAIAALILLFQLCSRITIVTDETAGASDTVIVRTLFRTRRFSAADVTGVRVRRSMRGRACAFVYINNKLKFFFLDGINDFGELLGYFDSLTAE